jgi:D-alanine-D-alanine ligase-like ATP-grasp enzyme
VLAIMVIKSYPLYILPFHQASVLQVVEVAEHLDGVEEAEEAPLSLLT